MLTGNEKIKDLQSDDICNYLGNSLCALGATSVGIENVENHLGKYRVLIVKFGQEKFTRIGFNCERALNTSIQDIRKLIVRARKNAK